MIIYAAFLRGIMPSNPNMRNEKLRGVFEASGLTHVQTVISSGNLIFSTDKENIEELENILEKALEKKLGIKSAVFIRSHKQITSILKKDPFKEKEHSRTSYLLVSFLKKKPHEIFTVIDLSVSKTPDFMKSLEKEYGKEITSRTLKTVQRIIMKMEKE